MDSAKVAAAVEEKGWAAEPVADQAVAEQPLAVEGWSKKRAREAANVSAEAGATAAAATRAVEEETQEEEKERAADCTQARNSSTGALQTFQSEIESNLARPPIHKNVSPSASLAAAHTAAAEDELDELEDGVETHCLTAPGVAAKDGAATTGGLATSELERKLQELLRKTDRYSARIHGGGAAGPLAVVAPKNQGTRGRRALSEKEEDDILLQRLQEEANQSATEESSSTTGGAGTRVAEQPSCIEGKMKHYQIEGLNWLYQLHCLDINGILADEMGLGKTLQTISILALLQFEKNVPGPHLVICPRSTLDNWYNEVNKWCPRFRPARLHGTKEEREHIYETILTRDNFDVCITTYEMVIKDYHRLASNRFNWNYLVMDEAHRIKNEKSVLSEVVRRFRSRRRLLITGTPLQNNLRELWALLNFIMPQLFNNNLDFEALFDFSRINTEQQQQQVITTLHRILRPFMLRRLKADVARDLPPKREIYVFVGMSKLQKKLYADILSKNVEVLNAMSGNKTQMLNILMQLRKCCNHPYLFDGVEQGPPYVEGDHMVEAAGKMALLDKLLPRLLAEGSRVLLFSQMTRLLDILDDYCRWRGYEYCRIDGSTLGGERQERIDDFNAPNSKKFIFLLSTRAGGLGINLATADIVILFDSDFNPQMDLQAMDRAHRIGQKKKVMVYRFVTEATVEERIVERAAKKLKLDSLVIQKGRAAAAAASQRGPSTNELHDILQFGAQEVYRTQGESSITEADIDVILADAEQRTAEIQAQLTSLENKFDLSNISLDGGLHMYGADEEESSSQPGKPGRKKAIKLNKPATFFELGDRKTKWRGEAGNLAKKERKLARKTLSGWRAEINGGYDFQFFNSEQLDFLDSVQRSWQAYLETRKRKRLEQLREKQRAASCQGFVGLNGGEGVVAVGAGADDESSEESQRCLIWGDTPAAAAERHQAGPEDEAEDEQLNNSRLAGGPESMQIESKKEQCEQQLGDSNKKQKEEEEGDSKNEAQVAPRLPSSASTTTSISTSKAPFSWAPAATAKSDDSQEKTNANSADSPKALSLDPQQPQQLKSQTLLTDKTHLQSLSSDADPSLPSSLRRRRVAVMVDDLLRGLVPLHAPSSSLKEKTEQHTNQEHTVHSQTEAKQEAPAFMESMTPAVSAVGVAAPRDSQLQQALPHAKNDGDAPLSQTLEASTPQQQQALKTLLLRYCEMNGMASPFEKDVPLIAQLRRLLSTSLPTAINPQAKKTADAEADSSSNAVHEQRQTCIFPNPRATSFAEALTLLAEELASGDFCLAGTKQVLVVDRPPCAGPQQQHERVKTEEKGEEEGRPAASTETSRKREGAAKSALWSPSGGLEEADEEDQHSQAQLLQPQQPAPQETGVVGMGEKKRRSSSSSPSGANRKKAGRPRKAAGKEEEEEAAAAADSAALLQLLELEDLDDKNDPERPQEFTEEMSREKERLLSEGFAHWNRTEFTKFVSALIHYGKERLEEAWVAYFRGTNKSLEDLQGYAEVFFKRYLEVEGGDRIMQRVEKAADLRGALDLQRRAVQALVEEQLRTATISRPQDLQLPERLSLSSVFTADEDRMLLWGIYEQGINAYPLIHAALKYYWFDSRGFFRIASHSLKQVEERCKEIVAAVEADLSDKPGKKESMRLRAFRPSSHRTGRPPTRLGSSSSSRSSSSQPRSAALFTTTPNASTTPNINTTSTTITTTTSNDNMSSNAGDHEPHNSGAVERNEDSGGRVEEEEKRSSCSVGSRREEACEALGVCEKAERRKGGLAAAGAESEGGCVATSAGTGGAERGWRVGRGGEGSSGHSGGSHRRSFAATDNGGVAAEQHEQQQIEQSQQPRGVSRSVGGRRRGRPRGGGAVLNSTSSSSGSSGRVVTGGGDYFSSKGGSSKAVNDNSNSSSTSNSSVAVAQFPFLRGGGGRSSRMYVGTHDEDDEEEKERNAKRRREGERNSVVEDFVEAGGGG